nr:collagen alpha-1(I) chain [Oryctolagus cuniculus]
MQSYSVFQVLQVLSGYKKIQGSSKEELWYGVGKCSPGRAQTDACLDATLRVSDPTQQTLPVVTGLSWMSKLPKSLCAGQTRRPGPRRLPPARRRQVGSCGGRCRQSPRGLEFLGLPAAARAPLARARRAGGRSLGARTLPASGRVWAGRAGTPIAPPPRRPPAPRGLASRRVPAAEWGGGGERLEELATDAASARTVPAADRRRRAAATSPARPRHRSLGPRPQAADPDRRDEPANAVGPARPACRRGRPGIPCEPGRSRRHRRRRQTACESLGKCKGAGSAGAARVSGPRLLKSPARCAPGQPARAPRRRSPRPAPLPAAGGAGWPASRTAGAPRPARSGGRSSSSTLATSDLSVPSGGFQALTSVFRPFERTVCGCKINHKAATLLPNFPVSAGRTTCRLEHHGRYLRIRAILSRRVRDVAADRRLVCLWRKLECVVPLRGRVTEQEREKENMYSIEYYTAVKNNEIQSFATKWRNLENIMLSELSQSQRDKYHMFSLIGDN